MVHRAMMAAALIAVFLLAGSTSVQAGGDWNEGGITWRGYAEGLAEAKKNGKPVVLVFFTEWCPHCTRYSGLFHEEKVVSQSKNFVMIRLDKDKEGELSGKYAPDGEYIPRTFFLSANGDVMSSIKAPREKYQHFFNPQQSGELLAAMDLALKAK